MNKIFNPRTAFRTTLTALLSLCLLCLSAVTFTSPAQASVSEFREQIAAGTNFYRQSQGLSTLTYDASLEQYAQAWAEHLARTGEYKHNPNLGQQVYSDDLFMSYAENLVAQRKTGTIALEAWIGSDGHRKNLVGDYNRQGVGVAYGGPYDIVYIQVLAYKNAPTPAPTAPPPTPTPTPTPTPAQPATPTTPTQTGGQSQSQTSTGSNSSGGNTTTRNSTAGGATTHPRNLTPTQATDATSDTTANNANTGEHPAIVTPNRQLPYKADPSHHTQTPTQPSTHNTGSGTGSTTAGDSDLLNLNTLLYLLLPITALTGFIIITRTVKARKAGESND